MSKPAKHTCSMFLGPWPYAPIEAYPCDMAEWAVGYQYRELGSRIPPIPVRVCRFQVLHVQIAEEDGRPTLAWYRPPCLMEVLN